MNEQEKIRNFCIIAHIDHGKSTLSDRLLECTGTVEKRKMKEQLLDQMDIERERGITIKLAPARMEHKGHVLNLIDTPGHVDFHYEVSRSLAAVEGVILLVDAAQGVQAQTIGNLYLALEENLTVIPVLNKIDLPAADIYQRTNELVDLIGCEKEDILCVSGKTGEGVEKILDAVIDKIPCPDGDANASTRALVFDSTYDDYKGVIAYVRVVDGILKKGSIMRMMATKCESEILELGSLIPKRFKLPLLETGQIGYVVTGLKDITGCRVGDTMTLQNNSSNKALAGYKEVRPMVFAGIFPEEGSDYERLREAIERLKLNDAALQYNPENSAALGFGFRCGLLGMLHLEIVKERLEREFGLDLIVTTPSVAYKVEKTNGENIIIKSPQDLPEPSHIAVVNEPWVRVDMVTPKEHVGSVMALAQDRRGIYKNTEYLSENQVILHYEMPLSMIIVDFYDKLKSATSGYASLNYEELDERAANICRLDIFVAEEIVEALASLVYRSDAEYIGRSIVKTLKDNIPREQFIIKLQAAIGGKIVAGDRLSALRKDVTAKLYGGDVTRKRKLLQKQKKGKAKMAQMGKGKVHIPADAYLKVLKR
jgi:GTP-binding protein LepA